MNIIDYLSKVPGLEVTIVTNKDGNNWLSNAYSNNAPNIKILRLGVASKFSKKRYHNYIFFYLGCLFFLVKHSPDVVLYFMTISSWPGLIYKKLRGKRLKLMVHYHEYTSTAQFATLMRLTRWMHRIELKMYHQFAWISHTNEIRLQQFKDDNNLNALPKSLFHVMPNYPPRDWIVDRAKAPVTAHVKRLVYVGSLGYKNFYLQELIDWVTAHGDEFTLDIYAYNMDQQARETFKKSQFENIRYHGGSDYHSLPAILRSYDIGLVIYKPFSVNTVNAVSNKVFEYLSCGLDVWFSKDMTYTLKYVTQDSYPKVIPVDFTRLDHFDHKAAVSREGMKFEPSNYYYENIYNELLDHVNEPVE